MLNRQPHAGGSQRRPQEYLCYALGVRRVDEGRAPPDALWQRLATEASQAGEHPAVDCLIDENPAAFPRPSRSPGSASGVEDSPTTSVQGCSTSGGPWKKSTCASSPGRLVITPTARRSGSSRRTYRFTDS